MSLCHLCAVESEQIIVCEDLHTMVVPDQDRGHVQIEMDLIRRY